MSENFRGFTTIARAAEEISMLCGADPDYIASDLRGGCAFEVAHLLFDPIGGDDVHVSLVD